MASSYFVPGDTPLSEGGGEPSLEYYEDPYGSLRMPLSIWVILRIYNEDAMLGVRPCSSCQRRVLPFLRFPTATVRWGTEG